MLIEVLRSKLHRIKVTGAKLDYIGSITLDEDLITAAQMVVGEKVSIVNVNNGERFETYIIKGKKGSGEVTLNGPAARRVQENDMLIVIAYAFVTFEEAQNIKPTIVFPNEDTNLLT